jgi:hypothetical protein
MLVFKPEWKNRIETDPLSVLLYVAAIVLLIGFAGIG